ncbi:MAG: DUF5723 family protein [Paludibacter sp.]
MKRHIYKIVFAFLIISSVFKVNAQQVNMMYFMDNVPLRNTLNPAFQPLSNFYLGFPLVGYTQFGMGNSSITLKDLIYKDPMNPNGNPITFLNKNGSKANFVNSLEPNTLFSSNLQINLLDFGFRTGKSYWNFSLTQKIDGNVGIPQDFMKLLLYGTNDPVSVNKYDLTSFGGDVSIYTEAGLGYSKKVNDKWSYGVKFKFLYGTANVSLVNQKDSLYAGIDKWKAIGQGIIKYSTADNITSPVGDYKPSASNWLQPAGMGGGIDFGLVFKPTKHLTFSAAVIDLGMIKWTKNTNKIDYTVDAKYTGMNDLTLNNDFGKLTTKLKDSLLNSAKSTKTTEAYTTYTSPKLNIGAEYGFFENNNVSLGVLSRTMKYNQNLYQELTGSLNLRPIEWFNMSVSYSVMNGGMSNIGAGIGLRTGITHWFFTADYLSLVNAKWPLQSIADSFGVTLPSFVQNSKIPVAYKQNRMNFAIGVNIVLGNRKDADRDGVVDRKDKCPETPFGVLVDKKGCPVDNDGDGVPDYLDKCPNTPKEAYNKIDMFGCPLDTDNDSVPDYLDKCPDTPVASIGFVDKNGCSLDSDNDGVYNYIDKCPNTPKGVAVDSLGCPLDTDGDGIADYLDLCPGTVAQARGMVDKNGCPIDSDNDGVADYLDLCPGTPVEARGFVDKNGCSHDSDDDGIPDYLDKCPNTPKEARGMVDEKGCPRDTDGDGVLDYLDNCPKVPGVAANKGCPEVKKEVKKLFQKALQGIQFETGKSTIKPASFAILNQIAEVLVANPTYLIEIQGHTDNVGNAASNLSLSEKRAAAVKDYLIGKAVAEKRMTSKGFGDTLPVVSNNTAAGKAKNRRVEFVVTFEETSFE